MEQQSLTNFAVGGLVTLLVGSITWLFVSVLNHTATIQELRSKTEQTSKLWQQIGRLKEDVKEIDMHLGELTASNLAQSKQIDYIKARQINYIKDRMDGISDKVSYIKGESSAIKELRQFMITQVTMQGDTRAQVAMGP